MSMPAAPQDAGTVPVRVQVIDMDPFALDLVVPTYLPIRDLSARLARDAGLGGYWEDGTRRIFWVRARGRVLQDEEKLQDLGIVPHELLHLLPQPPAGSGVQERPPEYPQNKGYAAGGNAALVGGLAQMGVWAFAWTMALSLNQGFLVSFLPAIALALHVTSFSRHIFGGEGTAVRIPIAGLGIYFPMMGIVLISSWIWAGIEPMAMFAPLVLGVFGGMIGVLMSWLAWYGAVEPLPERTAAHVLAEEQEAVYACGICGLDVPPDVRTDCMYRCGRVFHTGCYQARQSVWNKEGCAVCGWVPGQGAQPGVA